MAGLPRARYSGGEGPRLSRHRRILWRDRIGAAASCPAQGAVAACSITAAQILLTLNDTEERRRYLNARSTLATLLAENAVPVINENDTVATSEIRYGDNDRLAARVSSM